MKALSYLKENNINLPFSLNKEIGYGGSSVVYSLINDYSNVLKLSVIYDYHNGYDNNLNLIKNNYNYIIDTKPSNIVVVNDFKYLLHGERKTFNGIQRYSVYYVLMEKLIKINDDEWNLIDFIWSNFDINQFEKYSFDLFIKEISSFENKELLKDFDLINNILIFIKSFDNHLIHNDIHKLNIMKDDYGSFKMIDLDDILLLA